MSRSIARIVPGRREAETCALPENGAAFVDHTGRVDHRADRRTVETTGDAERDELAGRDAAARADADAGRAIAGATGGTLLRAGRAGGDQPVSVHAMLRTVSFTLEVAAKAADGSNPEWIPQCSQRGSFPGP